MLNLNRPQLNDLGDTIIEVILCIAVLGTAMAVAYASVGHSLRVGTDAGNRDRASGYIQQQVELIKLAEQTGNGHISNYIASPGQPFCLDPSTGAKISANSTGYCTICINSSLQPIGFADVNGACASGDVSTSIAINYDDATKIFTFTAKWSAPNGSSQDQSTAYYKLADSTTAGAPPLPSACTPKLPNLVQNPDFNPANNPGSGVSPGLTNLAIAKFSTGLPFRGINVYPDDNGSVPPNTGWHGGYSIRTGYYTDKPGTAGYVSGYLEQYPFPGDPDNSHWPYNPATGTQVAVGPVASWFYSNPVQGISDPKGYTPPGGTAYTGVIWRQTINGLLANTKYIFSAYFDNLYSVTEPSDYSPYISFDINGASLFNQRVLANKSEPKSASSPWQYIFGTYTTASGETSINISVSDNEGRVQDDDYAMTHIGLYQCK